MSGHSDRTPHPQPLASSVKMVVSGGFGVGKTTFIGAISEIEPLATEAAMTEVSVGVDDPGRSGKTTTTVALDFGRITLDRSLVLYLFGTPGQERFEFLWDDLLDGALGAVVLVDTERVEDCYPVLDFLERRGVPFVVAVNRFDTGAHFDLAEVREALDIDPAIHLMDCDARDRESVKLVLVALLEQVLLRKTAPDAIHPGRKPENPSRPGSAAEGTREEGVQDAAQRSRTGAEQAVEGSATSVDDNRNHGFNLSVV